MQLVVIHLRPLLFTISFMVMGSLHSAHAQIPTKGPELMKKAEQFGEPGGMQNAPASVEDPREFAKFAGISPQSRFYKALLKREIPATLGSENDVLSNAKVIGHLRGKEGIPIKPFPKEKAVEHIVKKMVEQANGRKLFKQKIEEETKKLVKDIKLNPLPACSKDQTIQKELKVPASQKPASPVLVSDVLFISKETLPPLSKEFFFGENINIVTYDPEKPNVEAYAARYLDINCLPTRRRLTNKFNFTHQGRDALRNYDQDLHGKGEYLLSENNSE